MYLFDSRIRYSETDSQGRLTMSSLLNYFQDCSTFQSEDLGVGLRYLREKQLVWVVCSWQIAVERFPKLGESVKIGTLPYEFKGFLGYRNFAMMTEAGEYLAKANSLWSLLNTETGKPAAVPEKVRTAYRLEERIDMEYAPRKIAVPKTGAEGEPIVVREHHLDANHHVNNGQYVNIAIDFTEQDFEARGLRAEYKKQAFLGDVLYPYIVKEQGRRIVSLNDKAGSPYAVVELISAG